MISDVETEMNMRRFVRCAVWIFARSPMSFGSYTPNIFSMSAKSDH